jgi:predicted phage tail protein
VEPIPTAPSTTLRPEPVSIGAPANFGQLGTSTVADFASCLRGTSAGCFSVVAGRQSMRIGANALSAPLNLTGFTVVGTTVTLFWTATAGAVSYLIEAGSSSGSANLASLPTGNALTTFSTTGVPAGTYFVRVRAIDASGIAGSASNEVFVVVGGGGCVLPGAPSAFGNRVLSGGTVLLSWTVTSGATSYILEAGSAPGLANLANADVGATTTFTATGVAPGTYYARVRARNACGTSAASFELTIFVPQQGLR